MQVMYLLENLQNDLDESIAKIKENLQINTRNSFLQGSLSKSPINKLADLIIDYAVKMCASDIHFEPQQDYLQIRFRIDGVLLLCVKSATTNSNSIDIVFKAHGGYGYFRKEITARWKYFIH